MKGCKIIFAAGGAVLDLGRAVEAFDAVVQNACVNVAQEAGSDPIMPDKGTDLLKDAVQGAIVSPMSAGHTATKAGLDTLFFSRGTDHNADPDNLSKVQITPSIFPGEQMLKLNLQFTALSGKSIGSNISLI